MADSRPVSIAAPRRRGRQVLPTDQPPEGATRPDAKPRLSFAVPVAKGKAPRHLADLDLSGRKQALKRRGCRLFAPTSFRATISRISPVTRLI